MSPVNPTGHIQALVVPLIQVPPFSQAGVHISMYIYSKTNNFMITESWCSRMITCGFLISSIIIVVEG